MANKISALFIILGLSASGTNAQLIQDLHRIYTPGYGQEQTYDSTAVITPFGIVKPGIHYGLSLGTGYSFVDNGVGLSSSYVAPSISYSPSQKLQVIAGASLSRSNLHGAGVLSELGPGQVQASGSAHQVWAYTQYNFTNRFSLYAMGWVSQNQPYYSPFANSFGNYRAQTYGVGFNYRISGKTSIGASINLVSSQHSGSILNSFNPFFP